MNSPACVGLQLGLEEVVGPGDLEVGRHQVAGAGHPRHGLGGDEVDEEVGGGRKGGGLRGDAEPRQLADGGVVVDGRHRHHVEAQALGGPQLGRLGTEAGDHAQLAALEQLEGGARPQLRVGERERRVAEQLEGRGERLPRLVGGENQGRRLDGVVEEVAAAGVDERRQPAQRRRHEDALGAAARAAGELGSGPELVERPRLDQAGALVDDRHVETALRHLLEVDQVGVVVDDHRRDAVGHALLVVGRGEREHGVAGVAVAEVDAPLVDELEQRGVALRGGDVLEVGPREQEDVGRVVVAQHAAGQLGGVGEGAQRHLDPLGARGVGVDDAAERLDLLLAPVDAELELDRRRCRPRGGRRRGGRVRLDVTGRAGTGDQDQDGHRQRNTSACEPVPHHVRACSRRGSGRRHSTCRREKPSVRAGPGAPHGAWPLVAASCGTRGCHSPTRTRPQRRAAVVTRGITQKTGRGASRGRRGAAGPTAPTRARRGGSRW